MLFLTACYRLVPVFPKPLKKNQYRADLEKTQDMLKIIEKCVKEQIVRGATLQQILEKRILADYAEYASFIDETNMVKIAHRSITQS